MSSHALQTWRPFTDNLKWVKYFYKKNEELKSQGKSLILEFSADVLPNAEKVVDFNSVIITNQKPPYQFDHRVRVFALMERSWYGGYYFKDSSAYMDVPIDKKYNCLMNRLEVHRQSAFYELLRFDQFNDGLVSMLCENREYPDADLKLTWTEMHHKYNQCFDAYLDTVLDMLPFRNFDPNKDIREIMTRSAYTMVMETTVDRPDSLTFTEKTMRSLQLPRPFLLMSSTGSVQYLRQLGFDVFDSFVDHAYDELDTSKNAMPRLVAILRELSRLCQEPTTPSMVNDWKKICQHNIEVMISMNQNFDENFSVIDSAFDFIMERN